MDLGITGKTALVMGASKGIGRAIAAALAGEGAKVAMASRTEASLKEASDGIEGETAIFPADSDDLERLAKLPAEVEKALGPIEILIVNTGGPPFGAATDNEREEWDGAYRTLLLAPRELIQGTLPGMRERGWGRIVNVSSTSVIEPIPFLNLSNALRMAAVGYFKTLSREVAADGVTVNTVATGRFATDRLADGAGSLDAAEEAAEQDVPAARLGQPEEYGDLVAFLSSTRAAYLTGAVIPLDGGVLRSV